MFTIDDDITVTLQTRVEFQVKSHTTLVTDGLAKSALAHQVNRQRLQRHERRIAARSPYH